MRPPCPSAETDTRPREPVLAARFRVWIGGDEIAVARVSGLALAGAEAEGRAAWDAPALPVRLRLARALDGDRRLYAWRREAMRAGGEARREVVVRQLDGAGRAVHGWSLVGWPLAWAGPELDANAGGLAWETLEIVADDLTWLEEGDGDHA